GGGGGGGSSFLGTLTSAVTTPSFQTGHGLLVITYVVNGGIVTAAATSTLICTGTSINLTTSGTVNSYTWNTGSNSSSLTVSPTTNTVYSVSATNSIGCISNASLSIVVNSGLPVLSVATSTNQTCLGKTVTLTATGANTYTWNNGVVNGVSYTPTVTSTYIVSGQNACGTTTASTTVTVAPIPVVITAPSQSICAGAAIGLTVSAAATNYTWAPVAFSGTVLNVSPVVNTIYSVAVSDGTCGGVGTFSLSVVANPTVSATISATQVCAGTTVSLSAQGSSGVTYNWTPGNIATANATVAPTVPTAYSVGVTDAAGCSTGTTVVVITMPSPTLTLNSSALLVCSGDPVNIGVTGASSYLWNDGSTTSSIAVNPTTTTIYSVTGTAAGCSSVESVTVTVFDPILSITGPTAVCAGDQVNLNASGADTYTWLPSNTPFSNLSDTPLATTIYTLVTLTASGSINCPETETVQVIVNANPTVTAVASRTAMCKNEQVVLTASGANTYSWSNSATTASITVTSSLITTLNYVVTGIAANGCVGTSNVQIKVNGCNAINELNGLSAALQIYPNPSNGDFTVQYTSEIKLTLVNELGQLIKVININSANDYKVHVSGLSNGIYFIKGIKDSQNFERKIIVNK
ncbi:MAG: T9SS type A sorting domain-containing protein, partial [Bacteroidia bacterium]|nr:T9SS type A sorting domain-containing protein [Bacteroidia bacterium]